MPEPTRQVECCKPCVAGQHCFGEQVDIDACECLCGDPYAPCPGCSFVPQDTGAVKPGFRKCPGCGETVPFKPRPKDMDAIPGKTCTHCGDEATIIVDSGPNCGRDHCDPHGEE